MDAFKESLKEFIEKHKYLIDNARIIEVYCELRAGGLFISEVEAEIFSYLCWHGWYPAGINPLNYINSVPLLFGWEMPADVTEFKIPSGVRFIEESAFRHCASLTSIEIPSNVTRIGDDAFYGCIGLTSITIPPSVKWVGAGAFKNCTNLKEINITGCNTTNWHKDWRFGCDAAIKG